MTPRVSNAEREVTSVFRDSGERGTVAREAVAAQKKFFLKKAAPQGPLF